MQTNQPNSSKKKPLESNRSDLVRYSSMGTQMLIIIGLGVFSGYYLDKHFQFKVPVFTLILSLSSVAAAIYLSIKDFLKKK